MSSTDKIASPCISLCCLDEEDVCIGCYRHIDEITGWHGADKKRRQEIIENTLIRKEKKDIENYRKL
ncbi:MAG: DUF1289 domain-containing protein [Gammaproteobacteria bacterium]|nr:DUF1289 domain-containing protein [Gammaproteobacteria bacterium]MDH5630554.1 DUF1289 domain-containing protein [Gammaproteobacteria bacterium]